MLLNLALELDFPVWESKRMAEIVMAALTKKSAGALARSGSSGGISMFSDNVGQVAALSCGAPIHNFSRGLIGSTTAHMRLVNCSTSSH